MSYGVEYMAKETGIQVNALFLCVCLQYNTSHRVGLNKCWLKSRSKDSLSLDESLRTLNTENCTFSRHLVLTTLLRFRSVGPLPMDMLQIQLNSMIINQTAWFWIWLYAWPRVCLWFFSFLIGLVWWFHEINIGKYFGNKWLVKKYVPIRCDHYHTYYLIY